MNRLLTSAIIAFIAFTSCDKKNNSNITPAEAADDYIGNYVRTDTLTHVDFNTGDTVINYSNSSGSIAKISATTVFLNNIFSCDSLNATVTATSLVLLNNGSTYCGQNYPLNFICYKSGNILQYSYQYGLGVVIYFVKGQAIKQ